MNQQRQVEREESAMTYTRAEAPALTAYLDALQKPLASLGEAACAEWRLETEAHLQGIILAHQELGCSYEEAIAIALHRFGDTEKVGQSMVRELRHQRKRETEHDAVRFYEPIALGFTAQIILMFLVMDLHYHCFTNLSFSGAESGLRFLSVLLFVVTPISAGWRFRMTRRSPDGFLGIPTGYADSVPIRAVSWAIFLIIVVGIGAVCGVGIVNHISLLPGLLYLLLALLGEQLAALRIRGVMRKLGTGVAS